MPGKDNKTGFKGVFHAGRRFKTRIGVGGKIIHLGTFDTAELAFAARNAAAKKLHGEFARTE